MATATGSAFGYPKGGWWPEKQRWQLIETMLSGLSEEVTIGLDWLWRSRALFKKNDLAVFDNWMLKEASNHNQKEVFRFVMKHKNQMPRTALRYADELDLDLVFAHERPAVL